MTKLEKAIKIVNKRLPKSYLIPIKTYKTIHSLLKASCRIDNCDYNKRIQWYNDYFANSETNTYMKTKYWRNLKPRKTAFDISALAGIPIMIAENNIKKRTVTELVFLIIHEYGHHWLFRHGYDDCDEKWCDEFAIRWTRKLIKEGKINEIR